MLSRRIFLQGAAASPLAAGSAFALDAAAPKLKSLTGGAKPISAEERRARIEKAQALMAQRKLRRYWSNRARASNTSPASAGADPSARLWRSSQPPERCSS